MSQFHTSLMSFCPILQPPFDFTQPLPLPALNCLERIIEHAVAIAESAPALN